MEETTDHSQDMEMRHSTWIQDEVIFFQQILGALVNIIISWCQQSIGQI